MPLQEFPEGDFMVCQNILGSFEQLQVLMMITFYFLIQAVWPFCKWPKSAASPLQKHSLEKDSKVVFLLCKRVTHSRVPIMNLFQMKLEGLFTKGDYDL